MVRGSLVCLVCLDNVFCSTSSINLVCLTRVACLLILECLATRVCLCSLFGVFGWFEY